MEISKNIPQNQIGQTGSKGKKIEQEKSAIDNIRDSVTLDGNESMELTFPSAREMEDKFKDEMGEGKASSSDPCSTGIRSMNDPCFAGIKSMNDPCHIGIKSMNDPCHIGIKSMNDPCHVGIRSMHDTCHIGLR